MKGGESPKNFAEFHERFLCEDDFREVVLGAIVDLAADGNLRKFISESRFSIVRLRTATFKVLTSDRPVVLVPGQFLAMPLTPASVLMARFNGSPRHYLEDTSIHDFCMSMNKAVVERAVGRVFSEDDSQDRFIQNRISKGPEILPFAEYLL